MVFPPPRRGAPHGARVGHLPPEGDGMKSLFAAPLFRRVLWGLILVGLLAAGLWLYLRHVWYAGPTITWEHKGQDFELLSPRWLGIVLMLPYFLWMIGKSLADLPLAQRIL